MPAGEAPDLNQPQPSTTPYAQRPLTDRPFPYWGRIYSRDTGANAIYTDVWASMGQEAEAAERAKIFAPYQVNDELFAHAAPHAYFMHCLPAHRGEEVTASVIDSPRSIVFDQAENRMHIQKSILLFLLGSGMRTSRSNHA